MQSKVEARHLGLHAYLGAMLFDAPQSSMFDEASTVSRFSMSIWMHVSTRACVHIRTLKRHAAEAWHDTEESRRTKAPQKRYYATPVEGAPTLWESLERTTIYHVIK